MAAIQENLRSLPHRVEGAPARATCAGRYGIAPRPRAGSAASSGVNSASVCTAPQPGVRFSQNASNPARPRKQGGPALTQRRLELDADAYTALLLGRYPHITCLGCHSIHETAERFKDSLS
jgi:hypothetical protein